MDRAAVLRLLDEYEDRIPSEAAVVGRIRSLVSNHENCFERDCLPGHVTGSAWIVSRESGAVLLTHHRKLDRWLQLGGHLDGEADVLAGAIREAEEESGMTGFVPWPAGGPVTILDVDVHAIPARGSEPEHEHHDIRFLLEISDAGQSIQRQESESKAMRWFNIAEVEAALSEESLLRMARKAVAWREGAATGLPRG